MGRNYTRNRRRNTASNADISYFISNLEPPDEDVISVLDESFSRKFVYRSDSSWFLPSVQKFFKDDSSAWQDNELVIMKSHLNDVKSRLNNVDIVTWQNHTKMMHLGGLIARYIQQVRHAEMCTQAWCKFHEILGTFPSIAELSAVREWNTVHLCEAPGAFIASLNHFLVCREKQPYLWRWLASTLNPYYEGNTIRMMIEDDSLISQTTDYWCFGADNTGDIFSSGFLEFFASKCAEKSLNCVDLVTADGSVDCANEPEEQEMKVGPLHYAEAVTALNLLHHRGSLVLKMFTLFEHTSVCLLYLLCCTFTQVHVFKPVTSKPGNSEVYIIAECYNKLDIEYLSVLKAHVGAYDGSRSMLAFDDVPLSFVEQHRECCARFMNWQTAAILTNIATFEAPLDDSCRERHKLVQMHHAARFASKFCLHPINDSDRVVPSEKLIGNSYIWRRTDVGVPVKRRYTGTLLHRQSIMATPWIQRVQQMETVQVHDIDKFSRSQDRIELTNAVVALWNIECGKPLMRICSSAFCHRTLLANYCEFLENIEHCRWESKVEVMSHFVKSLKIPEYNLTAYASKVYLLNNESDETLSHLKYVIDELNMQQSQSIEVGTLIVGSRLLDCITGDDNDYVLSLAPLLDLIDLMKVVKEECSCVLTVGGLFTRRTAGILYVLCSCFSQVIVYKDGSLPVLFLIAVKFEHCPSLLHQHIAKVEPYLCASEPASMGHQLLSFVPMSYLHGAEFYSYLRQINDDYLKLRVNHFQCVLRESLNTY